MPADIQVAEKVLNANDRCDKCGSQAYFAVLLETGELYFCRHHFIQNESILKELATDIIDQSAELHRRQETGSYPDLDPA
jgi:hypothetical protein